MIGKCVARRIILCLIISLAVCACSISALPAGMSDSTVWAKSSQKDSDQDSSSGKTNSSSGKTNGDQKSTDKSSDKKSTDQKSTDKSSDKKNTDTKNTDKKNADTKNTDKKSTSNQNKNKKSNNQKSTEKKSGDKKSSNKNSSDKKSSDQKSTEKKSSNTKKAVPAKKNGFLRENGHWYYYFDGEKMTGWFFVDDKKYYGVKSGYAKGRLVTGWQVIDRKRYFFRESGNKGEVCSLAVNGVATVNGISCKFNEDGEITGCTYAGSRVGFVNIVGELARMNQVKNNILASLVVAQACVETGYGTSIYHNNLFGIREGEGYRSYNSWQDSIDDYVKFMHTYIPQIFGVRDAYTACAIIGRAGYAEAPNYATALISVVNQSNLTRFNR
jgi:flagellum-specific peptidoglycan hydrolase FlgJ